MQSYTPKLLDIWALSVSVFVGSHFYRWNDGLVAGFGSYSVALAIMTCAYSVLILSVAEISSAVSFTGGGYNLARCTIGMYPGYMIGSCKVLHYLFYTALTAYSFAKDLQDDILHISHHWRPIICLLFYVVASFVHILGDRYFWYSNALVSVISLGLLLLYCFDSFQYFDFIKYAQYTRIDDTNTDIDDVERWFRGGAFGFFQILPSTTWFFIGAEILVLTGSVVSDAKKVIPSVVKMTAATVAITTWLTVICACSTYPGVMTLSKSHDPLHVGLSRLLRLSHKDIHIILLPTKFASAFGLIFGYSRILHAMSKSNLFPKYPLSFCSSDEKIPYGGIVAGSIISFAACIFMYYFPRFEASLFSVTIMLGFIKYLGQCYGYQLIKTNFKELHKDFQSPFGIPGVIYAAIVFSAGIIATFVCDENNILVAIIITGILLLFTLGYYLYGRKKQGFDDVELALTFKIFIIKHNMRLNFKIRKGTRNKIVPMDGSRHNSRILPPRPSRILSSLFDNRVSQAPNAPHSNHESQFSPEKGPDHIEHFVKPGNPSVIEEVDEKESYSKSKTTTLRQANMADSTQFSPKIVKI